MTDPKTITVSQEELPKVYDEAFTVKKQRWGTYVSQDLDGNALITSLSEEACVSATRWYLKAKQEGFTETETSYDSVVAGKL
jgi:hypothetical protein